MVSDDTDAGHPSIRTGVDPGEVRVTVSRDIPRLIALLGPVAGREDKEESGFS